MEDEQKLYAQNMSKWSITTLALTQDKIFELVMKIVHKGRAPWQHFANWMKKTDSAGSPGKLAQLVFDKEAELTAEWFDLLTSSWWLDIAHNAPADCLDRLPLCVVTVVFRGFTEWERRIASVVRKAPASLLGLAKTHPNTPCDTRKALALSIKDAPAGTLEMTACMLLQHWPNGVTYAAETGKLDDELYGLVDGWCREWSTDTVEVESANKCVANVVTQAPRITLPLVSARVACIKRLGLGTRNASLRWSDIRGKFQSIQEEAVEFHDMAAPVMGAPRRWTSPVQVSQGDVGTPSREVPAHTLWALKMNLKWYAAWQQLLASDAVLAPCAVVIIVGKVQLDATVYFCSHCYKKVGQLLKAKIVEYIALGSPGGVVRLSQPPEMISTVDCFSLYWWQVSTSPISVRALPALWDGTVCCTFTEDHAKPLLVLDAMDRATTEEAASAASELQEYEAGMDDQGEDGIDDFDCAGELRLAEQMLEEECQQQGWVHGEPTTRREPKMGSAADTSATDTSAASAASACPRVFRLWLDRAQAALDALYHRAKAMRRACVGQDGQLSLVEVEEKVESSIAVAVTLVHWIDVDHVMGQKVVIRDGHVVYSVSSNHPIKSFANAHVIHPAVGVRMEKRTVLGRPVVPCDVLVLKLMWEQALTNIGSDGQLAPSWLDCYWCSQALGFLNWMFESNTNKNRN